MTVGTLHDPMFHDVRGHRSLPSTIVLNCTLFARFLLLGFRLLLLRLHESGRGRFHLFQFSDLDLRCSQCLLCVLQFSLGPLQLFLRSDQFCHHLIQFFCQPCDLLICCHCCQFIRKVKSEPLQLRGSDHSEVIAPELTRREGETDEQKTARVEAWIANRVPDIRFLLDQLLSGAAWDAEVNLDPARIGIVGHSFGGWTALAVPEVDGRIRAVVALAPGGSSQPPPNIIPAQLTFKWGRDVPTLYLVAENDTALPLAGMYELFERTRATKHMVILRRADHGHFGDEVEQQAEL